MYIFHSLIFYRKLKCCFSVKTLFLLVFSQAFIVGSLIAQLVCLANALA